MELEIPPGLTDMLQDFTVQVLREKPDDIVEFAANYFMRLKVKEKRSKEGRKGKKGRGVSFESEEVNEDEGMEEDNDFDDYEEEPGIISTAVRCKMHRCALTNMDPVRRLLR